MSKNLVLNSALNSAKTDTNLILNLSLKLARTSLNSALNLEILAQTSEISALNSTNSSKRKQK